MGLPTRGFAAATAALAACALAAVFMAAPAFAWSAGSNNSSSGPALVGCSSPLNSSNHYEWLAFTGTDGQLNLLDYNPFEGYNSSGTDSIIAQYRLGVHLVGGPAIACTLANKLVLAWRSSSNQIVLANAVASNGTIVLSNTKTWPETTDASPSVAGSRSAEDDELVVGWAGTDSAHHINLAFANTATLAEGTKYQTSDYTRANAGVGVGELVYDTGFYIGFIAAVGTPNIYIGHFPTSGTTSLNSVRTTDASAFAPSVSETEVFWKGYTNNKIYEGSFIGTNDLGGAAVYTDTTITTPAIDQCLTAYTGTNNLLYYDTEDFCHG